MQTVEGPLETEVIVVEEIALNVTEIDVPAELSLRKRRAPTTWKRNIAKKARISGTFTKL